MKKNFRIIFVVNALFLCLTSASYSGTPQVLNPIKKFLNDIEYTSRLKVEYDDNIFLTESNEDADWRQIFTQSLNYKVSKEKYFFQGNYTGNYAYYNEEAVGILGHKAGLLYSYRPYDNFSFGIRDDYNWLQDSKITSTIGDRVLALGYIQNTPMIEIKYELNPETIAELSTSYQFLDVRNAGDDDYIDNQRLGVRGKLSFDLSSQKDLIGFVGLEHDQISFPQISEKSAVSERKAIGFEKKFFNIMNVINEVGFKNTYMDDENNHDDSNIDFRTSLETVFSIYTKLRLSYDHNRKSPSLRRQYTQYSSNLATVSLNHLINSRTSFLIDYSYEKQNFDSSEKLAGQEDLDRKAGIHNVGLTLSRKLNLWLSLDMRYDHVQRKSDFDSESYIDNKYSAALTAKY